MKGEAMEAEAKPKKFRFTNKDGYEPFGTNVLLELGNSYVSAYGKLVKGKAPDELAVDESCQKEYALNGGKPTVYTITRME